MDIQKDVPVPVSMTNLLSKLDVGDSVLIPGAKQGDASINGSRNTARRLGIKIKSKRESGGIRIWRME